MNNAWIPLIGVGLAGVGWVIKTMLDLCRERQKRKNDRWEKISYFFVDILIIRENLRQIFSDEYRCKLRSNIEEDAKYRAYVISFEENTKSKYIIEYLPSLSLSELVVIRSFLMRYELYCDSYNKLGGDEFASLPKHRKKIALEIVFNLSDEVVRICDKLVPTLKKAHPELCRVEKRHERLQTALTSPDTKRAAGGDREPT